MNWTRTLGALALSLTFGSAVAAPINIAIVGAPAGGPTWNADVATKLTATGNFSSVTVIDGSTTTPSLALLKTFSAVLFYSDAGFANSTTLGNNLADYVDAGGGVVQMVFANVTNGGLGIGGRYASGGYQALVDGSQSSGTELTIGTRKVPGSPLLTGVTSFDGGTSSYFGLDTLAAGATDIADWSNGTSLIATQLVGGHTTVELNFYPVSSDIRGDFWKSSTQGALLMSNALLFASGNAGPVAVPEPDTLALLGLAVAGLAIARRRKVR